MVCSNGQPAEGLWVRQKGVRAEGSSQGGAREQRAAHPLADPMYHKA